MSEAISDTYEKPAVCGFLKFFAWLGVIGGGILIFSTITTGIAGLAASLSAIIGALLMFGLARLVESVDRIQKTLAATANKSAS